MAGDIALYLPSGAAATAESLSAEEAGSADDFADAVLSGLARRPRSIPCRFFYDARGSELFEEITRLPEYYLTRAETSILERCASELVGLARPREIVEIGAGYSRKTQLLLEALVQVGGRRFVPIDVSPAALTAAGARLAQIVPPVACAGLGALMLRRLVAGRRPRCRS